MGIREPHREIIKTELYEAIGRDITTAEAHEAARKAARVDEMNHVADVLAEHGPLSEVDGMAAFLFGMYGLEHYWREDDKGIEQTEIEKRVGKFGHGKAEQPFSLSDDERSRSRPREIYAFSRDLFNAHMRRAPIDSDFTAAEYGIEKSVDIYIGRIAIPVVAVNFENLTPSNETSAVVFQLSRRETEEHPNKPRVDVEPQFGTLIAEWKRHGYHTDYYVEELQRVQKATKILKASLRPKH